MMGFEGSESAGEGLSEGCIKGIAGWYGVHGTRYPWTPGGRGAPDAYGVWVSEVMLQQTTTAAAAPRYRRWMERYPTIESLADSDEEDVLREWEGLGYYSRARNLFSAAGEVRRVYGGSLPRDPEGLRGLPGVGEYIAAAVASIAFDYPAAAVEANGRRIAQRLAASEEWNRGLEGAFRRAVEAVMIRIRPGTVNAAVMQFGQRICLPRSPRCGECPVARDCRGRRLGIAERIPSRRRQEVIQKNTDIAVLMRRDHRVWLEKRTRGIGRGLWAFPALGEVRGIENWSAAAELPGRIHLYTRYRDKLRPRLYEPLSPEIRPRGARPGETRPGETRPGEAGPGETRPRGARPGEAGPGETRPRGGRPGETRPKEARSKDTREGCSSEVRPSEVRSPEAPPKPPKHTSPTESGAWHTMDELAKAAMPSAHRKIAEDIVNLTLRRRDK